MIVALPVVAIVAMLVLVWLRVPNPRPPATMIRGAGRLGAEKGEMVEIGGTIYEVVSLLDHQLYVRPGQTYRWRWQK